MLLATFLVCNCYRHNSSIDELTLFFIAILYRDHRVSYFFPHHIIFGLFCSFSIWTVITLFRFEFSFSIRTFSSPFLHVLLFPYLGPIAITSWISTIFFSNLFHHQITRVPYARHYKPRLVYFLPHFQRPFLCF